MGYLPALGGKAAHLVSDLATVILNPVSERERQRHRPSHLPVSSSCATSFFPFPPHLRPEGRSLCSANPVSFLRLLFPIRAIGCKCSVGVYIPSTGAVFCLVLFGVLGGLGYPRCGPANWELRDAL